MSTAASQADVEYTWTTLKAALSQDASERRHAEEKLSDMSTKPGFCTCLIRVLMLSSVETSPKWLAAVQLKNIVAGRWVKHSRGEVSNALQDDEKALMRSDILQLVGLKDQKLALHVAIVISKMARHDYPTLWGNLFDQLAAPLVQGTADEVVSKRIWLTLHHALKELATKRLPVDQQRYHNVAGQLLPTVWAAWSSNAQTISSNLPQVLAQDKGQETALGSHFETWFLVTKILRRLVMHGITKDTQTLVPNDGLIERLPFIVSTLNPLLSQRPCKPTSANRTHAMLDSALLKLLKLLNTVIQVHPWALDTAGMLIPTLMLCCSTIKRPGTDGLSWGKLVARCMCFVNHAFTSPAYHMKTQLVSLRPQSGSVEALEQHWQLRSRAVQSALTAFWERGSQRQALLEAIVQLHAPLTPAELADWQADPEAWYHMEAGVKLEEETRGILEVVLRDIVSSDERTLGPLVANAVQHARTLVPVAVLSQPQLDAATLASLTAKEGIYCAACTLEFQLYDHLDFSEWLQSSLLPEMLVCLPHNRILQRRCMRCIAAWTSSLISEQRPTVYHSVLTVLRAPSSDVCVQLVAVETLREMVADWDFNDEQFAPFLQPLLSHMPSLLQACESFDSHTLIFTLVSTVVERMGDYVHPHASTILSWLPQVWEHAEGQGLLRMQVLTLLQRLTNALGLACTCMQPIVLPVLDYSLNAEGPEALNLLEDALLLWLVALRNAPDGHTQALNLWHHWVSLMATSIEHVPSCMRIASSCILLGDVQFLQAHGVELADALAHVIGDIKSSVTVILYMPLLLLIQLYRDDSVALLSKPLLKLLHMLLSGEEDVLTWSKGATVFGRALIHCPAATLQLFEQAAAQGVRRVPKSSTFQQTPPAGSGSELLAHFFADWTENFDCIAQPADRKLCAMALASGLTLKVPALLEQLDMVMTCVTAVYITLEGSGVDDVDSFGAVESLSELADIKGNLREGVPELAVSMSEDAEGETNRRQKLMATDPVLNVKLSVWTKERMQQALQVHGSALEAAAAKLPGSVSDHLKAIMR